MRAITFAGRYEMTAAAKDIQTPLWGVPRVNAVRKAEAWDRAKLLAL